MEIHASMAAEALFHIGPFTVTNTMLTTWVVIAFLTVLAILATRRMALVPESRLQNLMELIIEFLLDLSEKTAGPRVGRAVFPLIATLFIFILTANWFGILPIVGTITLCDPHHPGHCVPVFRAATSDLNITAAMALIAITTVQVVGVTVNGVRGYLKELTTPLLLAPIHLIGEISHVVSLSARLFGNIFGGEVLLVVMFALVPYFVPIVFMGLEMFFGFIQALIFSVLTIVYIALAAGGHGGGEEHAEAHS
jgi:F-type H+-transporting ATPase subunit a